MSDIEDNSKQKYQGGKKKTTVFSALAGERLKQYRLHKGLSQMDLAEGICSSSSVSNFELGKHGLSMHILAKLADKLLIPLHEIYRPNEHDQFPTSAKLELIEVFLKRKELDSAKEMIDFLKTDDQLLLVEKQELEYLEAEYAVKNGDLTSTIEILQPLIDRNETHQTIQNHLLCKMLNLLGTAYYKIRNFTKSYATYKRGYQISLRFPVVDEVAANVAYNLGLVCKQLELRDEATHYLEVASTYYNSVHDLTKMADSFFVQSVVSGNQQYLKKALVLYEGLELQKMVQIAKQHQAFYIDSVTDHVKAIHDLMKVAEKLVELEEIEVSVFTLSRAIIISVEQHDWSLASACLQIANQYADRVQEEGQYTPYFYFAKAKFELMNKQFERCLYNAYRSAELYANMGMMIDRAEALEVAILALKDIGEVNEALNLALEVTQILRQQRRS